MTRLAELQRQMSFAIRSLDPVVIPDVYRPPHLPSGEPLSVYGNHHRISLSAAITVTFPTVAGLIGAETMRSVAAAFVITHPPRQPCVSEYGSEFAGFLETGTILENSHCLADLARLDWAVNLARIAVDAKAFSVHDLVSLGSEDLACLRVARHPALTLLASDHGLPGLYQAIHDGTAVDFGNIAKRSYLMIWRQSGSARFAAVDADAFAAAMALAQGQILSEACGELQRTTTADFIAHILCSGAFVEVPRTG